MNSKLLVLIVLIIAIASCAIVFLNRGMEKVENKFDVIDEQAVIDTKN